MNTSIRTRLALLAAFIVSPFSLPADKGHDPILPQGEKAHAAALGLAGPTETTGVGEVRILSELALDDEFEGLGNCVLRTREITLLPGGKVAVHEHQARPGVDYILEGEAVEHRSDSAEPVVRRKGDVAVEHSGIIHWWENVSDKPARVVVVDIVRVAE